MSTTYPHRRHPASPVSTSMCRCGDATSAHRAEWGHNCAAALRERVAELERTTPGPHIPPALLRRIEALGFVPGGGEPVGWLLGYVEGMAALLTTAQGERDELAATLANERGEGEPPVDGFHWSHGRRAWVYQPWLMRPKETGPERVVRQGPLGWELYMDGIRTDAEYVSARASMADSPAVVAARSADGGAS